MEKEEEWVEWGGSRKKSGWGGNEQRVRGKYNIGVCKMKRIVIRCGGSGWGGRRKKSEVGVEGEVGGRKTSSG